MTPKKLQYSPHKHWPIDYRAKQQIVQPTDTSAPLNDKGINRVQDIVRALLYVGRAFKNKLLASLRAIGAQQAAATKETADAIDQLLDYVATYPDNGINFRKVDTILAANADDGFINKSKPGAKQEHIYFSQKMTPNQN